tara:strand:+ start:67 stop:168 length:102 start_codon:yes stop_codon:yes gene_type:complete
MTQSTAQAVHIAELQKKVRYMARYMARYMVMYM